MAELVTNCPRCGAQSITFDLTRTTLINRASDLNGVEGTWEGLCQVNSPRGTIPGCTFDDPATFGIAFRLKSSATPSGCITDTA